MLVSRCMFGGLPIGGLREKPGLPAGASCWSSVGSVVDVEEALTLGCEAYVDGVRF